MKIIAIKEITPFVAEKTGWSIPMNGRVSIPAIIAITPITKEVMFVTESSFPFFGRFLVLTLI